MVHFFGILSPDFGRRRQAPDAPNKAAGLFGRLRDAVPPSRAERDACYLAGKAPEPDEDERVPVSRPVR